MGRQRETGPSFARRWGSRLVALTAGAIVALALGELAMHALDIRPQRLRTKVRLVDLDDRSVFYDCYPSNPHGELAPAPDVATGSWQLYDFTIEHRPLPLEALAATPWCVAYRLSSLGLRDRELPRRPPVAVTRILGVGDSFAFGEGVPARRGVFAQLDALLGARYRVVNGGRSALDLAAEREVLERAAATLGVSRAILVVIANDIALTPALRSRQRYINDLIVTRDAYLAALATDRWYGGRSRLLRTIGSLLELRRIGRETLVWYHDAWNPVHNRRGLDAAAADFRRLAELDGCQVAVAVYPLMVRFDPYPLASVHATIVELARAAGLPALDLAPAFRGRSARMLRVHPADHHPNGDAHAIAARALARWLRELPEYLADGPAGVTSPGSRPSPP